MINFFSRNWFTRRYTWQEFREATGVPPASHNTIRQELEAVGYRRCVACKKPFVSEHSRRIRLQFQLDHRHWKSPEKDPYSPFRDVVFSDEFQVWTGIGGRAWVIRAVGERDCSDCTSTTRFSGRKSISYFGFFGYDWKGALVRLNHSIAPELQRKDYEQFEKDIGRVFKKAFDSIGQAAKALQDVK